MKTKRRYNVPLTGVMTLDSHDKLMQALPGSANGGKNPSDPPFSDTL
jgi:hypothetical protein